MLDPEKINYYLALFKNLDLSDLGKIFNLVKIRNLEIGEIYIQLGDTNKKVGYIKKGLIRSYFPKENGDSITNLVRWEDQVIASYDIIIYNRPSRFIFEALEKTTILEVDFKVIEIFLSKNPHLHEGRQHFIMNLLGDALDRIESFVLLSPEERYLHFLKSKPNISNRLPDKYIASLLGITPVSLSRIRKRIATTKKR